MGKKILSILIILTVIAGCSQNKDKEGIAGAAISTLNQILDKTEEQQKAEKDQTDNNKENSDEKKVDKEEIPTADAKSNDDGSNNSESKSNINEETPTKSTGNKNAGNSNNDTDQSSNSTVPETPKPSQPQEPTQPSKPVEPTPPSKPVCDDTLPAGTYPREKEDEVCTQIEKEMIKNLAEGKPTFKRYEIEYGATECGTEYFYIIPIY